MPNILQTYEQDLINDTLTLSIHVIRLRYGGDIVALALMGDSNGEVADHLSEEDFWKYPCSNLSWFPIGVSDTYFGALEKLKTKMESIEYSDEWRSKMWSITTQLGHYDGINFEHQ